jgi:hypothetical protein
MRTVYSLIVFILFSSDITDLPSGFKSSNQRGRFKGFKTELAFRVTNSWKGEPYIDGGRPHDGTRVNAASPVLYKYVNIR